MEFGVGLYIVLNDGYERRVSMNEINILIGGETGYGINDTGISLCRLFNRLGYHIYMYNDFPSNVRGGHQFAMVRAATEKIAVHRSAADVVLAFTDEAVELHKDKFNDSTIVIYDSDKVNVEGLNFRNVGLPLREIVQEAKGKPETGGACMIGALCKAINMDIKVYGDILKDHFPDTSEQRSLIAKKGYEYAMQFDSIDTLDNPPLPVLNGSQAIAMGLLKAGLKAYVAYPMTPTSPIMEFLAASAPEFGIHTVPPESEIAVMMMALGYSYMGMKSAVGTSGGGFSLMVEGLGLAGMAELPVLIVMGQRAGPSTGMPTYTAQTDMHFVLNASQGEFPRLIIAPGDAEEAYYWSGTALNKAWKYQLPAFILTDKTLNLGYFGLDFTLAGEIEDESPILWDGKGEYKRYKNTENGVSPLAFAPIPGQVVKTNSYVHDENGVVSEIPLIAKANTDKRFLKEKNLALELEEYETVKVYGEGSVGLICWGSNKGVCVEVGEKHGLKVIQMLLLSPFPEKALKDALHGVEKLIGVECNATGQLAMLLKQHGFKADELILKYDGRPFAVEELENEVKKVIL